MPDQFDVDVLNLPDDSQIAELIERCPDIERLIYRDGDYLVKEGEESNETYLILQGSYVVEQGGESTDDQRGQPLAVQFSDEDSVSFIGEMAYLGSHYRTASVRCSGSVHALVLLPEHLDVIINEFPYFARVLSKRLTERLREADALIKKYRADLEMNSQHEFKGKGDAVLTAGEPATHLCRLMDGSVVTEGDEGEVTLSVSESPSDFLNAREYFANGVNSTTYRVKSPAILALIDQESKPGVIRNFPELILSLLGG